MNDEVKVSVLLPRSFVDAVNDLAQKRGCTRTEVIRKAISTEVFLDTEVRKRGHRLLLHRPETWREVIWPH